MSGNERRKKIIDMLLKSPDPISGTNIAKAMGVSRQVIVSDMALLRASDKNIISTNRGYMIFSSLSAYNTCKRCIRVNHQDDLIRREMEIIVDNGGKMLDTIVEHDIYGQIAVDLIITNREDIDAFLAKKTRTENTFILNKRCAFPHG